MTLAKLTRILFLSGRHTRKQYEMWAKWMFRHLESERIR